MDPPRIIPKPNGLGPLRTDATLVQVPPYHAEQNRGETQLFKYAVEHHKMQEVDVGSLNRLLGKAGQIPRYDTGSGKATVSKEGFVGFSNSLSKRIRREFFRDHQLLVMKNTEHKTPQGHPTDTDCRPDYAVASEDNWRKRIPWSSMELVGEDLSKGCRDSERKTVSYMHYFLSGRPDLKVALGVLTSKDRISIFVGFQGSAQTHFANIPWTSSDLVPTLYNILYRLYDPGLWRNSVFTRRVTDDDTVVFDLCAPESPAQPQKAFQIQNLLLLSSTNPFGTRTHVLRNKDLQFALPDGTLVPVVKEQLCKATSFNEKQVYDQIHGDGDVPGVARLAFHAQYPEAVEDDGMEPRTHHITGLQDLGRSFMELTKVQDVLIVIYDAIEALRYMRSERKVLHRDISKGNILVTFEDGKVGPPHNPDSLKRHPNLCYIAHLLDKTRHQHETKLLLIDFNHGQILSEPRPRDSLAVRTGTPGFVSRAIEKGGPLEHPGRSVVVSAPPPPPPAYKHQHPGRCLKFPPMDEQTYTSNDAQPEPADNRSNFQHEINHEIESVFWVLFYWLMGAQPKDRGDDADLLDQALLSNFASGWDRRHGLIKAGLPPSLLHPAFAQLGDLVQSFCDILMVEGSWIPSTDCRRDPDYVGEAFQRLILQFVMDHKGEPFMTQEVDTTHRRVPSESHKLLSYSFVSAMQAVTADVAALPSGTKRRKEAGDEDEEDKIDDKGKRLKSHI